MYRIDIMTLFPDVVGDMLCESVLGRGQERGYIRIECHQIRDYTLNKQRQVDDYPYGGGRGAVMQADPLYQCWKHICDEAGERVHTIYMSPAGKTFCQAAPGSFWCAATTRGSTSASLRSAWTRRSPWGTL